MILDPEGPWCRDEMHRGCWKSLAGADARNKLGFDMGFHGIQDQPFELNVELIAEKAKAGSKRKE